ncbi:MAG TPA: T9SS type A sorting domain-containing protein, partial [Saprospiraceae bacterium]|nr:T9SS type A sorting domain-containing protein [Saprospiraceae bacterium]
SVWDESWNTDFCEVELKILDNVGSRISGKIADENNAGLPEVEIIANANISEYPKVYLTDVNGNFGFDIYDDTELLPTRKGDDINGVSTLDLVYIQRHILGIESLNSPYKMIAADANNDKVISASDLSEIRKLILGIITKFRNNESWRFPTSRETLDPSNPFNYSEKVITKTDDFDKTYNFTAVKIGDVNNSAKVDDLDKRSETRSNDKVTLNVIDVKVNEGEIVRVPVTSDNFNNVSGFQYTMHLSGAELMGVEKGALNITESNIGNLGNGIVTMSYAGSEGVTLNEGEVLFTMVVRGEKASKVSEIFSLTSAVTKAESYNGDLKVGAINLEVRTAPVASIELYQNEPNPFKGQTTVSFMMPEAGAATLSVYDMTGKLVVTRSISAVKGLNSEVFTKDQLGVSGVMYYTLESGDFSATKKMIVIE